MVEGEMGMIVETSRVPTSPIQCGSVEVAFDYEAAARKMTAHIIQARGIPSKDIGGANNTQVSSGISLITRCILKHLLFPHLIVAKRELIA